MPVNSTVGALTPDMFDYSRGEASALGFEPLAAQAEKPEISVMKLSEYSQVKSEEEQKETEVEAEATPRRVVTFSSKVRWKTSQNSLRHFTLGLSMALVLLDDKIKSVLRCEKS